MSGALIDGGWRGSAGTTTPKRRRRRMMSRDKASMWSRVPATGLTRRARVGAKQLVRKGVPAQARHAFRVDLAAMFLAGLYTGAVFPFVQVIARDDLKASKEILAFM